MQQEGTPATSGRLNVRAGAGLEYVPTGNGNTAELAGVCRTDIFVLLSPLSRWCGGHFKNGGLLPCPSLVPPCLRLPVRGAPTVEGIEFLEVLHQLAYELTLNHYSSWAAYCEQHTLE